MEAIKEAVREDKMKMKRKKDQSMIENRLNHMSSLQNEHGGEDKKRRSYPGEPPTTGTGVQILSQTIHPHNTYHALYYGHYSVFSCAT